MTEKRIDTGRNEILIKTFKMKYPRGYIHIRFCDGFNWGYVHYRYEDKSIEDGAWAFESPEKIPCIIKLITDFQEKYKRGLIK